MLAGLVLAGTSLLAHAAPEVKNGAWEITFRSMEKGMKLSPAAAAKMTPDQRAKAEQNYKNSDGKQFSRTFRSCNRRAVTAGVMLKVMSEKGTCTRKAVSSTETGLEVAVTCSAPTASQATFKYDAPDPKTVNVSEDEKRADGVTKHIEASAHWVGTCAHAG
jgi:hypothetical protein